VEWQEYDFSAEDLIDQGEIGHGNYGTVNKMYHEQSRTVMAVKVNTSCIVFCKSFSTRPWLLLEQVP